jgi:hypothetical protein
VMKMPFHLLPGRGDQHDFFYFLGKGHGFLFLFRVIFSIGQL